MRLAFTALLLVAVTGCSIKQHVTPAAFEQAASRQICMIPERGVRESFHQAYRDELLRKGFEISERQAGTSTSSCDLATRYTANWSWDLAMYMSYADIKVFQNGRQVGHANYDAKTGGGRLDKFIDAQAKVAELTDQLFPQGAPQVEQAAAAPQAAAPLSRQAYQQQQLEQLMREGVSYEEYQRRYQAIMAGEAVAP